MKIYLIAPITLNPELEAKITTIKTVLKKDGHTTHSFSDICHEVIDDDQIYVKIEIEAFNRIDYDAIAFVCNGWESDNKTKGELIVARSLSMIILEFKNGTFNKLE